MTKTLTLNVKTYFEGVVDFVNPSAHVGFCAPKFTMVFPEAKKAKESFNIHVSTKRLHRKGERRLVFHPETVYACDSVVFGG